MKPITKYLAAGSMAAILLFSYKERSAIKSFFAPESKVIQQVANTKPAIPAETVAQFSEAAPVTVATPVVVKAKKAIHHQSQFIPAKETVVVNEPVVVAVDKTDNNNIVEEKIVVEENKAEAEISPVLVRSLQSSKPVLTVKKIDVSKLAKDMSKKVNEHLQAVIFSDDFAMQNETEAGTDVTINEQPAKTEVVNVMKGHKMAGNAFEGFTTTIAPSPSDLTGFATIKQADKGADSYTYSSVYEGSEQLKEYAVRSGNNSDFAIIVNLGLKSGKRRFFVVDLTTNTIVKSGVVAEGKDVASFEKKYSNEIGSSATSLGIYKIGQRVKTDSVSGYRLLGLQQSNSNAYNRAIMLKATEDVPYDEINFPVLKTDGSLSLSAKFLKEISPLIDKSTKPVLLWAYDQSADIQASNSLVSKN